MSNGMKLKACSLCHKVFAGAAGQTLCWDCQKKVHKMEDDVIAFVREHPNTHVNEIHEETGAPFKLINDLMKKGVFEMSGAAVAYPCKACGKPIFHGTYCEDCLKRLQKDLHKAKDALDKEVAEKKEQRRSAYFYSFDDPHPSPNEPKKKKEQQDSSIKPLVKRHSYLGNRIYGDDK